MPGGCWDGHLLEVPVESLNSLSRHTLSVLEVNRGPTAGSWCSSDADEDEGSPDAGEFPAEAVHGVGVGEVVYELRVERQFRCALGRRRAAASGRGGCAGLAAELDVARGYFGNPTSHGCRSAPRAAPRPPAPPGRAARGTGSWSRRLERRRPARGTRPTVAPRRRSGPVRGRRRRRRGSPRRARCRTPRGQQAPSRSAARRGRRRLAGPGRRGRSTSCLGRSGRAGRGRRGGRGRSGRARGGSPARRRRGRSAVAPGACRRRLLLRRPRPASGGARGVWRRRRRDRRRRAPGGPRAAGRTAASRRSAAAGR